jgi:hypothetical protein
MRTRTHTIVHYLLGLALPGHDAFKHLRQQLPLDPRRRKLPHNQRYR